MGPVIASCLRVIATLSPRAIGDGRFLGGNADVDDYSDCQYIMILGVLYRDHSTIPWTELRCDVALTCAIVGFSETSTKGGG